MVNLLKNGFIRREDLDFTDDGARFTAYEYNGIVVTKTTYNGEYFISIRVDYLKGFNFIYDDYSNKDWYKLCDEFNGVREVDVEKLKENINIIKKGVDELEEEIKKDPINIELIEESLNRELKEVCDFINEYKDVDIMKFSTYEISNLKRYFNSLDDCRCSIMNKLSAQNYTRYDYKTVQKNGYLRFKKEKSFYCTEIEKLLNK